MRHISILSEEKTYTVGFRVTESELKQFQRVADILFQNKQLKSDSVGALARASTMVQVNQFIQLELMQKIVEEQEVAKQNLQVRNENVK